MLLLFDIDGTLVQRASGEHAQAMRDAMSQVHGIPEPEPAGISSAGRTDNEIARLVLTQAGVPAATIDLHAADVERITCERYAELVPDDLSAQVPDGLPALLEELSDEHRLALVTGNFEPVARLKLRAAGVEHHFPTGQGGFGSDSEDRTELPPLARARAGTGGQDFPRARTVVIGDTPRDIACARADGVRVVAVTTGPFAAEDLQDADAVARSAPELGRALAAISPRR